MFEMIDSEFNSHIKITKKCADSLKSYIYTATILLDEALKKEKKIYLFGNNANHMIADYIAFKLNKKNDNVAVVLEEDNKNDKIFENQIKTIVNEGDLLIGISTSGNSKNVLRGLSIGRTLGCKTVGLSGYDGGAMNDFCDVNLIVPSDNISRIEEFYLAIGNIISNGLNT